MHFARKWLMGHLDCVRTKGVAMLCGQIKHSFQTYQQRHAMHALNWNVCKERPTSDHSKVTSFSVQTDTLTCRTLQHFYLHAIARNSMTFHPDLIRDVAHIHDALQRHQKADLTRAIMMANIIGACAA